MNEILKAVAYSAADENSSFNPLARNYVRTERATTAYRALAEQLDKLGGSLDEVNELNDLLCDVSEAYMEQGFLNGAAYGAELERELNAMGGGKEVLSNGGTARV